MTKTSLTLNEQRLTVALLRLAQAITGLHANVQITSAVLQELVRGLEDSPSLRRAVESMDGTSAKSAEALDDFLRAVSEVLPGAGELETGGDSADNRT